LEELTTEDIEPAVRERSCDPDVIRFSRGGKRLVGALISSESSSSISSPGVERPLGCSVEAG